MRISASSDTETEMWVNPAATHVEVGGRDWLRHHLSLEDVSRLGGEDRDAMQDGSGRRVTRPRRRQAVVRRRDEHDGQRRAVVTETLLHRRVVGLWEGAAARQGDLGGRGGAVGGWGGGGAEVAKLRHRTLQWPLLVGSTGPRKNSEHHRESTYLWRATVPVRNYVQKRFNQCRFGQGAIYVPPPVPLDSGSGEMSLTRSDLLFMSPLKLMTSGALCQSWVAIRCRKRTKPTSGELRRTAQRRWRQWRPLYTLNPYLDTVCNCGYNPFRIVPKANRVTFSPLPVAVKWKGQSNATRLLEDTITVLL